MTRIPAVSPLESAVLGARVHLARVRCDGCGVVVDEPAPGWTRADEEDRCERCASKEARR